MLSPFCLEISSLLQEKITPNGSFSYGKNTPQIDDTTAIYIVGVLCFETTAIYI